MPDQAPQIWRYYAEFHDVKWEVLVSTICPRGYWGADGRGCDGRI
jgi:hypothetical protein